MIVARVARSRAVLYLRDLAGPRTAGRRPRARVALVVTLSVALPTLMGLGAWTFFGWLAAHDVTPGEAATPLGLMIAAGLLALLVFELQNAVSVLLLDSDLELLRRAPLRPRALFTLKLADAIARSGPLLPLFLLPPLLGFGLAFGLPAWGWLLVPPALLALWALPLGLGVAVALFGVSRLPLARARGVLALLTPLTFTLAWLANSYLLPRLPDPGRDLPGWLVGLLAGRPALAALSPGTWAAAAFAAAAEHAPARAALPALGLLVAGLGALAIAALAAARELEPAQARVASPAGRRRRAPVPVAAPARRAPVPARARGPAGALLARDGRLLVREPAVLGDVLTSALLWTLLPYFNMALHGPPGPWVARVMLVTLAVALGYEIAARAVPFERDGLAWMRLAPIPTRRWLAARLGGVGSLALAVLAVAAAIAAGVLRGNAAAWRGTAAVALPALVLSLALGFRMGVVHGDPRWTNPRAMLGAQGRLIATVMLVSQIGLWLGMALAIERLGAAAPAAWLLPSLVAIVLALPTLRSALRRLDAMEWPG